MYIFFVTNIEISIHIYYTPCQKSILWLNYTPCLYFFVLTRLLNFPGWMSTTYSEWPCTKKDRLLLFCPPIIPPKEGEICIVSCKVSLAEVVRQPRTAVIFCNFTVAVATKSRVYPTAVSFFLSTTFNMILSVLCTALLDDDHAKCWLQ